MCCGAGFVTTCFRAGARTEVILTMMREAENASSHGRTTLKTHMWAAGGIVAHSIAAIQ